MSPSLLRKFWTIVEVVPTTDLIRLESRSLTEHLIGRVLEQLTLTLQEQIQLRQYIQGRVSLIRDLAESRQPHNRPMTV